MKKKNNGGFLLSESLIVSTFVLTVITLMFVQFKGVIVNNKKQYTYNNVEDIYSLGSLAEFFTKNDVLISGDDVMIFTGGEAGNCTSYVQAEYQNTCSDISKLMGADYIYYTDSDVDTVKSTIVNSTLDQDMKDFIERLNADKVTGRKRLVAKFTNGDFATVVIPDKEPVYSLYIYRWSTAQWTANQDISGMTEGTDYVKKASDVVNMDSRGANYYLKHKVEGNIVTENYVCFVTDTEHCLRGGTDNGENPSNFYSSNVSLLTAQESWFTGQGGSCTLQPSGTDSECSGGIFRSVYVRNNGRTDVYGDSYTNYCYVGYDGTSFCHG